MPAPHQLMHVMIRGREQQHLLDPRRSLAYFRDLGVRVPHPIQAQAHRYLKRLELQAFGAAQRSPRPHLRCRRHEHAIHEGQFCPPLNGEQRPTAAAVPFNGHDAPIDGRSDNERRDVASVRVGVRRILRCARYLGVAVVAKVEALFLIEQTRIDAEEVSFAAPATLGSAAMPFKEDVAITFAPAG